MNKSEFYAKETVGTWGTKNTPGLKHEYQEHKSNLKSLRRNESLEKKKKSIAAKMHIYQQHANALKKLEKRF